MIEETIKGTIKMTKEQIYIQSFRKIDNNSNKYCILMEKGTNIMIEETGESSVIYVSFQIIFNSTYKLELSIIALQTKDL